jgi:hypothetical protein
MARAGPSCQGLAAASSVSAAAAVAVPSKTRQRKRSADKFRLVSKKPLGAGGQIVRFGRHNSSLSTCRTNQRRWNCVAFGGRTTMGSGGIPRASGIIPDLGWYERASSPNLPRVTSAHVLLAPHQGHAFCVATTAASNRYNWGHEANGSGEGPVRRRYWRSTNEDLSNFLADAACHFRNRRLGLRRRRARRRSGAC